MKYSVTDALAVLQRTPKVLQAMLSGLPGNWIEASEGPGTWTPFDVLGHLIHGEKTDWIPRVRLVLEHGASRTFEPFDMHAQERDSMGKSISNCWTNSSGCARRTWKPWPALVSPRTILSGKARTRSSDASRCVSTWQPGLPTISVTSARLRG